jgi:hypothetical protein
MQVDDVNFGLQYPDANFDMVTSRFIAGGISNWTTTIGEMYRVLAGTGDGWIQVTEIRPGLYCDDNTLPDNASSKKWPNIFFVPGTVGNSLGTAQFDEIATSLRWRVEQAGFVDVHEYVDKAPVGVWPAGTTFSAMPTLGLRANRERCTNEQDRKVPGAWLAWLSRGHEADFGRNVWWSCKSQQRDCANTCRLCES